MPEVVSYDMHTKNHKKVEYFDITQTIQPDVPNAANAFQGERP